MNRDTRLLRLRIPLALLLGTFGILPAQAKQQLRLAAGGRTPYVILVGREPAVSEQLAAQELQKYLRQMTGALLPIVTEPGKRPYVAVGESAATQDLTMPYRYPGDDVFRIRTTGSNLLL